MSKPAIELKFVFKQGHSIKYKVWPDSEVNDKSMRGAVGGIMQLLMSGDYPVLTDVDGVVFCLPNKEEIVAIECKKVTHNGR